MSERPTFVPMTATVSQFRELSGLGKTTIFKLIKLGKLRTATVLNRRMILLDSYREMLSPTRDKTWDNRRSPL